MKKFMFILIALIGFGISANAQEYLKVTDTKYDSGKNTIEVTINFTEAGKQKCSYASFKVVPKDKVLATLLNDGVKYGSITNNSIAVYFGCGESEQVKEKAKQCRLYDFDVILTDCTPK
jgi:hypothetical protein